MHTNKKGDKMTTYEKFLAIKESTLINVVSNLNPRDLSYSEMARLGFASIGGGLMLIPRWSIMYLTDDFEYEIGATDSLNFVNKRIYNTHLMLAIKPMAKVSKKEPFIANDEHIAYLDGLTCCVAGYDVPAQLASAFDITLDYAYQIVSFWLGMSFKHNEAEK